MCLLAAATVWGAYPHSQANAAQVSGSIQYGVNFRMAPNTSSTIIRMIGKGEEVVVLDSSNRNWLQVRDSKGKVGYISSDSQYIQINESSSGSNNSPALKTNATIAASVSFRTGPSTDAARIRYMQKDEKVTITGKPNSYWYAVTDANGTAGYVSTDTKYITVTGQVATPPATEEKPAVPEAKPESGAASKQVEAIIAAGMKYLGTPYEYGSKRDDTSTFDCSDLIRQMFKDAIGVTLPADSRGQGNYVRSKNAAVTDWHKLKRGDLMFFMDYKGTSASLYSGKIPFSTKISHAAIYLGDGKVLHTYSKASGGVRTDSIEGKHWEYRFLYGGSAL
ncbi:SH3 domain-containing protein [Cohnella terricola]|uniref:SH3 domain-containing protein n=2 Tax=Cohnella terricola TaxID=1289167 RepID=A0A559JNM5_9BACL|nr:SH3 domain-containing protein [Cohnella terricola]